MQCCLDLEDRIIMNLKRTVVTTLAAILTASTVVPFNDISASALTYNGSSSYQSGPYCSKVRNVNLSGNQRTDIVNVAKSQIGYQEGNNSSQLSGTVLGSNNYTEYGRWYGLQDMWCSMFVSWCANTANVSTSIIPKTASTVTGLNTFKNQGRAYSRADVAAGKYTPQPGDIIYFKGTRNNAITNHVGIVTGYSNGTIHTVEGNTISKSFSSNGGAVCAKVYSISDTKIVYICCPNYTDASRESKLKDMLFDAGFYADIYADLKKSIGYNAGALKNHYDNYGLTEGRMASPYFDAKYYLKNNPDVANAYGKNNYAAALDHFVNHGFWEGRQGSQFFSAKTYLSKNPDIAKAYGSKNYLGALQHYTKYGINEMNRTASTSYNQSVYYNSYEDLRNAFKKNGISYIVHYITHGKAEGRNCVSYEPKKVTLTSVKSTEAKKATVSFKKLTFISGYEICYSASNSFASGNKTVGVPSNKTSKTLTGLSSKKNYYVKMRAYKTVNGKKYYGAWSSVKKVMVK